MKLSKRILSLLLSVLMMFSVVAGMQFSAGAIGGDIQPQADPTITFKPNATGVTNMPENITAKAGTKVTMPPAKSTDPQPTRDGYKFMGWARSSDANAQPVDELAPGKEYELNGSFTAYAVWRALVTLTYDGNGSGVTNVPAAQTGYGEITVSTQQPKRNEYTFKGWGQTAGATAAWKSPGDTIENFTANRTIYAVWKQYTLTFNANGGSGGPGTVKGGEVEFKESYEPTWSGHTFLGWAASSSATTPSAAYATGKKITLNSNLTVYAVWEEKKPGYTVTFYGNADDVSNVPLPVTGNPVDIPSQKPVRSGWTFLGWSTGANATKPLAEYAPGKTGVTLSYNVKLYAVWGKYTLTYKANGGSGAPAAEMQGGPSIMVSETKPTKSGYNFGGWATSSSAKTPSCVYSPGGVVTLTANTTLYAVWLASDENSVLFNANGGTGGPNAVVHKGTQFFIPETVPTRSGYDFVGWAQSKAAGIAEYLPGRNYNKTSGPVIFYAQWHAKDSSYDLSYSGNVSDGSVSNLPAKQTSTTGKWTVSSTIPTRSGYTFLGWEIGSRKTNACGLYRGGDTLNCTSFTTLFAIWAPNSATFYTVKFSANGGSGAPADLKHVGNPSIPIKIPTRTGYRFLGWSTSSTATTASYIAGYTGYGTTALNKSSVTLYAVWETYTITFDVNGGSGGPGTMTTGNTFKVPTTTPTKSGYEFVGWTKTKDDPSILWDPGETKYIYSDTTLYAYWKKTYTLTYKANGGSGAPANQTGYHIVIPDTKPTKSGYTFYEWNSKSDGTGTGFQPGDSVNLNGNGTLYAIWKQYTLTYDGNATDATDVPAAVKGGEVTITTAVPTRSGYTFLGWATSATATTPSTTYVKNYSFTMKANLTLYAVWEVQYRLVYEPNGSNVTNLPETQTHNGKVTLANHTAWREGYTFLGWGTSSTALAQYLPGEYVSFNSNKVLYAIWHRQGQTLKLSFNANANGDTVTDMPRSDYFVISNSGEWVVPEFNPIRNGYTFLGWANYGSKDSGRVIYMPGDIVRYGSDVALYAVWAQATPHTVTFDANGGSKAPLPRIFVDSFRVPDCNPVRDGYTFLGWAMNKTATVPAFYAHSNSATGINTNMTLYAVWAPKTDLYLICYNPNGGTGGPKQQMGETIKKISSTVPTRSGYTFLGWAETPDATTAIYTAGGSATIKYSRTLYAVWQKEGAAVTYGDVDGVAGITPADASKILQYCVLPPAEQATFFSAEQLQAADVDGINGVNPADASLILQYCVMSPEDQATYKFPAQP